jgi:hypothetical protein
MNRVWFDQFSSKGNDEPQPRTSLCYRDTGFKNSWPDGLQPSSSTDEFGVEYDYVSGYDIDRAFWRIHAEIQKRGEADFRERLRTQLESLIPTLYPDAHGKGSGIGGPPSFG